MSWNEISLRRIFRIVNGGTPKSDEQYWNGDVPWATPIDVGFVDGNYLASTQRGLSREGVLAGSRTVPSESLIISTRAPIGYVAQTTTEMAFNQGCRGLVPTAPADMRYFRYQLLALRDELVSRGVGSTFMELSTDALAAVPMTQPPLDEQRRIADFLDAEITRMDRLQDRRDRQLATLGELSLCRISAIIPDNGNVAHVRLGYLAAVKTGITVDGNREFQDSTVTLPYLRVANVQNGYLNLDTVLDITIPRSTAQSAKLKIGDVLMTEGGDLDKLGRGTVWQGEIENCLHQNHVFAVRPDQRKLAPEYLAMLTRTAYARSYFESTGTKTTNLASTSSSKIRDFKIPLIDTRAQVRACRDIDEWLRDVGRLEAVLKHQHFVLAERRQALITAAVTGQIDVTTARGLATAEGVAI
jgi:type I restriction enzyme, S subunit